MLCGQDPAGFCARADLLQRLAGSVLDLACPPVLWVSNGIQEGRAPDTPLWWAGGAWHHFPKATAYVPRTFEPSWHSVLSQPLRCLEPAPGELKPSGEVFQVHRVLLCGRTEGLWSRPSCGGAWSLCPFDVKLPAQVLELEGGLRYLFYFSSKELLIFDPNRNAWAPPSCARAIALSHQEEVQWQRLSGPKLLAPLEAHLLEATPDYVVFVAPVCRDGFQRRSEQDSHTALYFIACDGSEVVHHIPCLMSKLSLQRYESYVLLVKDSAESDLPQYPAHDWCTAAWLLDVHDWVAPATTVLLPAEEPWANGAWSLVISRGALPERPELQLDMAPRIYLLEDDADLRLWATGRLDEGRHEAHPSFGRALEFRHLMSFPAEADEACGSRCLAENWALWAPELHYAARMRAGRLWHWRCDLVYAELLSSIRVP